MNRLVLIDGHAIIHRAYWALPPLTSSQGQQVNAVYGFVSMLLRVIDDLKPTYLAVAFDLPTPTFRHEAYIGYQAKRPAMEEGMKEQIDLVHEFVVAVGIPIYTAAGYEADDVIGTIAKQAAKRKQIGEVVIVTGDRDILQLVDKKIKVYAPIKGLSESRLFNAKEVKEYMGVTPQKIIDYKALIGDQSDNYPGVPGIGPKTAIGLLERFGSIEKIYKAVKNKKTKSIDESVLKKLLDGYDSAMLSKKLATIVTDAPVTFSSKNAKLGDLSKNEKFISKLREFGFRSLVKRLTGESESLRTQSKTKFKKKKNNGQMGLL